MCYKCYHFSNYFILCFHHPLQLVIVLPNAPEPIAALLISCSAPQWVVVPTLGITDLHHIIFYEFKSYYTRTDFLRT